MHSFLAYIMIADSIMALIFVVALTLDKERQIEGTCNRAGININMLVIVGVVFGFIILPLTIMERIAKKVNNEK